MDIDALPQPPKQTDEERAAEDAVQMERAKKFTKEVSPFNVYFRRAAAVVAETEKIFDGVKSIEQQKSYLTTIQIQRYADALARLGRYKEAHEWDNSKNYDKVWGAIVKPDSLSCGCRPIKQLQQDGEVKVYPRTVLTKHIFSAKHGKMVGLYTCNDCGFSNVHE